MKTGDLIAFQGSGFISGLINLFTYGSPWRGVSHVGLIGEYSGEHLLFESTTLNDLPCVIQGKQVHGVQVVHLKDRLAEYNGKVWHYPLYRDLYEAENIRLNKFLVSHVGMPYDEIGAVRSAGRGFSWAESLIHGENLDHIFCSELIAASYRDIGILRTDNVSMWNPNRLVRHCRREKILLKPRRLK